MLCATAACDKQADIGFLLDESTSIVAGEGGYSNWDDSVLGFVKTFISAFSVGENATRVGVVTFSTVANISFTFNNFSNAEQMLAEVDSWKQRIVGGQTNISGALRVARTQLFSDSRSQVRKLAVLLTDGSANIEKDQSQAEAQQLKEQDVDIFCVGVTDKVRTNNTINMITSSPLS